MNTKTILVDGAVVRISAADIRRLVATGIERGWVRPGDQAGMAAEVRALEREYHAAKNREWRERCGERAKTVYA